MPNIKSSLNPKRFFKRSSKHPSHASNDGGSASASASQVDSQLEAAAAEAPNQQRVTDETTNQDASIWDEAYDKLKADDGDLFDKYERVLSKQLLLLNGNGVEGDSKNVPNIIAQSDTLTRRAQMSKLISRREERAEKTSQRLEYVTATLDLYEKAHDLISSTVESYPPAALALAGIDVVVKIAGGVISSRKKNQQGLTYVLDQFSWYAGFTSLLLRKGWDADAESFQQLHQHIRDGLLGLYKALVLYQVKTVCTYCRGIPLLSFLKELVQLNDWEGDTQSIQDATAKFLSKVDRYKDQLDLERQRQLVEYHKRHIEISEKQFNLMRAIEVHQQHQEDTSLRERVNRLIARFSIDGVNYEGFMNRNPTQTENTCLWFEHHQKFQEWKDTDSALLLVSGLPGSGKSVLARHLVQQFRDAGDSVVCHFFFKDAGFQDRLAYALSSVLHQLFLQLRPRALECQDHIEAEGPGLISSCDKLWDLLIYALQSKTVFPGKTIVIVLDGLDECIAEDRQVLVERLRAWFDMPGSSVKFLVTTRPYREILESFHTSSQLISLNGEGDAELASISQEIDLVIHAEVSALVEKARIRKEDADWVIQSMTRTPQRTYIWVRLILEVLRANYDIRMKRVEQLIKSPPKNNDAVYEALLVLPAAEEDQTRCLVLFKLVLAATEPLSCGELDAAIQSLMQSECSRHRDLDLFGPKRFRLWMENTCRFFVHVFEHKVYFIHHSAKEFLQRKQSCTEMAVHAAMAESCINYLSLDEFIQPSTDKLLSWKNFENLCNKLTDEDNRVGSERALAVKKHLDFLEAMLKDHQFLGYAVRHLGSHLAQSYGTNDEQQTRRPFSDEIYDKYMRLCGPQTVPYQLCAFVHSSFSIRGIIFRALELLQLERQTSKLMRRTYQHIYRSYDRRVANSHIRELSFHTGAAGMLAVSRLAMVEPSHWIAQAAEIGFFGFVTRCIERGDDINIKDPIGCTPLHSACLLGHYGIAELLLRRGADANIQTDGGWTPLDFAVADEQQSCVGLLCQYGAYAEGFTTVSINGTNYYKTQRTGQRLEGRDDAELLYALYLAISLRPKDKIFRKRTGD